jgi:NADP-dependent 3-hydroxy acid dehydrogenase YdfG
MTTYDELNGRTAVVTGAASGIGAATAALLAESGARVALVARRADRLADAAAKLRASGADALAVATDVTDAEAVEQLRRTVADAFGRVDLVVNAAGVMLPNPIEQGRNDEWQRMIDTNVTGVLNVIRAFTPDLLAAAADGRAADLVNVSSIGAHLTYPNYAVYGATKAAVTHLSATLRAEFGPAQVRVTNLEPGLTDTELGEHLDNPELSEQLDGMFSAIGSLTSADVADVVGFAVSRPRHVNLRQVMALPTAQV